MLSRLSSILRFKFENICFMGVEEKNNELYAKGGRNLIVTAMAKDFEKAGII